MGADVPLHDMRDEKEGDIPLDRRWAPGHQDHPRMPGRMGVSGSRGKFPGEVPVVCTAVPKKGRVLPFLPACSIRVPGDPNGLVFLSLSVMGNH
jgi:hypothetical protein